MNQRFADILNGKEGNYIFPFFWPIEGDLESIPEQIEKIFQSGCRALCVECRPYEGFCGPNWWESMRVILEEARKRGMKVWILDDKHFPTGYANGLLEKKYPERRRHYLREHHVDLMGPAKDMSVLIPPCWEGEKLLGICAFRRTGNGEEMEGSPLLLSKAEDSDFVYLDLPEGCWRVFTLYDSPIGSPHDHKWYINMLSRESVQVLLEAVYEPHFKHFGEYFGNTIAGFFSDEPSFACEHVGQWGSDLPFYYRTVGLPGTALPWDQAVAERMQADGIETPAAMLPALWYPVKGESPAVRLSYMNAITRLWNENFSHQLGDWCRAHGVEYVGHIIEDNNAHSRLGGSVGHYFRALDGQDMAGIDIVLQQIVPGMAEYSNAAYIAGGVTDPRFFHYALAQLSSSLARITPGMKGRSMCETFGAYGWAAGTPMMKWLIDFLLVRGTNHFVPHAFSSRYPDPDCPPHFYANGNNPQYEGFSKLMHYVNRASHLLCGADRQPPGAILYYAESEWMNLEEYMPSDVPGKVQYDAQIDYDILPLDALLTAECSNGRLVINGCEHAFLVIPEASCYPADLTACAARFEKAGLPVFTLESVPGRYPNLPGRRVSTEELLAAVKKDGLAHDYQVDFPLLRIAEYQRDSSRCFFLFNEAPAAAHGLTVQLPAKGDYLRLNLLEGIYHSAHTEDGTVAVELLPGESVLLLFDEFDSQSFEQETRWQEGTELPLCWDISVKETGIDNEWRPYRSNAKLENITGAQNLPTFSGVMRYETTLSLNKQGKTLLDLGQVGQTAQLLLNGRDLGMRISAPYSWDITDALQDGDNRLEILVANTLANRIHDQFSACLSIPASGLLGPVVLKKEA